MLKRFEFSVFRFDAKTDYEPYYKLYRVEMDEEKSLFDALCSIQKQDPFFAFEDKKSAFILINKKALKQDTILKDISEHFGATLTLEPLDTKRATKDLRIDTSDFSERLNLLKNILDAQELGELYESLMPYFYQSPVLKYDKLFQGSSLFLLTYKLIHKYPDKKQALLNLIDDKKHGIWLHQSLKYKIFPKDESIEEKILELKAMIKAKR